jgi:Protein of unknown function (DUF3307)
VTTEHLLLLGFTLFAVKHYICDFVLQTNDMIRSKGHWGEWRGIVHSVYHGVGTMVVIGIMGFGTVSFILMGLLDTVVHYHVDWAKQQLNSILKYTVDNPKFWNLLGLDQLLHQLTYVGILLAVTS